uniref:Nuclear pore complex protein Nup133 n=1 Tax=Hydra vulgaris TaxID=6087 RepID=T2M845_HYDVU
MYTPKRLYQQKQQYNLNSPFDKVSPFQNSYVDNIKDSQTRSLMSGSSKVIEKGESHELVTYGTDLPIEVSSILTSEKYVTALAESSGWAAVVTNQNIYAWRYTIGTNKKVLPCITLPLSYTALKHKSQLTSIVQNDSQTAPMISTKTCVINVSPEGAVRYWPNITKVSTYYEAMISFEGKQSYSLVSAAPYGWILLASTGEIYLITVHNNSNIQYQQLFASAGMLSGIGKRMSSYWLQPSTQESSGNPCLCCGTIDFSENERYFYVVDKGSFQKFEVAGDQKSACKTIFKVDLLSTLKASSEPLDILQLKNVSSVDVVDMKNTGFGTVFLLVLNFANKSQLSLGTLKNNCSHFESLIDLDIDIHKLEGDIQLSVTSTDYQAYISSSKQIFSRSLSKNLKSVINIQFTSTIGGILCAGVYGNNAIFLSRQHGFLKLLVSSPNILIQERILNEQLKTFDEMEQGDAENHVSHDTYSVLRNMLIAFTKGHLNDETVASILCSSEELRDSIIMLSKELLNSPAVSDPRWASQTINVGFTTSSVLIQNQLRDKEQMHNYLIDFLTKTKCFKKLNEQDNESVKVHLIEHAEKMECCSTILDMYSQVPDLISQSIDALNNQASLEDCMTKESFFANVTEVDKFFDSLIKVESDQLFTLRTVKEQVELIAAVSGLFAACFTASWKCRQKLLITLPTKQVFVPWTGSSLGVNTRSLLKQQIEISLKQGLPKVDSTKVGTILTQHIILLTDLLLDAFDKELILCKNIAEQNVLKEEYVQQRQNIILSLINHGYYEQAATIGEKYEDFIMLILLCEKTNDSYRLNRYKSMFLSQGFESELYRYYVEKGYWEKLLVANVKSQELDNFLSSHSYLNWLHYIDIGEYYMASEILGKLASEESEYAARKKVLLVLSNLAKMSSVESDLTAIGNEIRENDKALELLDYQEQVLQFLGKDFSSSSTISAADLIEQIIGDDYLSEVQFNMAIDLLEHINGNDFVANDVWSKCILQDRWDESVQIDILAVVSQKMFYKCLKYCKNSAIRQKLIPSLKQLLLSPKISDLVKTSRCQPQLQACYELLGLLEVMN